MTANKRILLNVAATYGRSLYALLVGLFCSRWAIGALGTVDYGLFGLIGGLVGFVSFVNNLLANAVSRFYAVSVGAALIDESNGLDECRRWFNTALSLHTVIPILLILVGYPLGILAIDSFLVIPTDRIEACYWVWRYTCVTCFISMFTVPFSAMYNAKQEIAELTIYGFLITTFNALFQYYMITHPGFWLTKYALWMSIVGTMPQLIIAYRAVVKYRECKFVSRYLFDLSRIKQVAFFAGTQFFSAFSGMFCSQGRSFLVNRYLGVDYNASISVGNLVSSHTMTLSGALSGAFMPAISNKAGEKRLEDVKQMSFLVCRISTVLMMIFAIPLILEIREVLNLWLIVIPPFAAEMCVSVLVCNLINRMSEGYYMSVYAIGKRVFLYSVSVSCGGFLALFGAWLLFYTGYGVWAICGTIIVEPIITMIIRLVVVRHLLAFSIRHWARSVFIPAMLLAIVTIIVGYVLHYIMEPSLLRVIMTALTCEMVLLPLSWFLVLTDNERNYCLCKIRSLYV